MACPDDSVSRYKEHGHGRQGRVAADAAQDSQPRRVIRNEDGVGTLKSLGLLDSYWAVILPETALTLPFGVLLRRDAAHNHSRLLLHSRDGWPHDVLMVSSAFRPPLDGSVGATQSPGRV